MKNKYTKEDFQEFLISGGYTNNIEKSSNMLAIEDIISDSIKDYFGIRNIGIQKINFMKNGGNMEEFNELNGLKFKAMEEFKPMCMEVLFEIIPERFRKTLMFKAIFEKYKFA